MSLRRSYLRADRKGRLAQRRCHPSGWIDRSEDKIALPRINQEIDMGEVRLLADGHPYRLNTSWFFFDGGCTRADRKLEARLQSAQAAFGPRRLDAGAFAAEAHLAEKLT